MRATAVLRGTTSALAVAIFATACAHSAASKSIPRSIPATTTTSTTLPPTTLTTHAAAAPLPGFGAGSRGPEVLALEQRLEAQHYDVGKVDGVYDSATTQAVMAFQKANGLKRTGRATDDVTSLAATASAPGAMLPGGGATRVEVDLKRQILLLFKGDALFKVLSVSTGSGKRYCVDGECDVAVTPGGSFRVFYRRKGWDTSKLGKLYNPLYFNGGIAIHGAPSVPAYPASHGCVRIPLSSAEWFPSQVPNGTPVYVIGGARAAVPFNQAAPDGTTGTPGPSTTSSSSSTTSTTRFPPVPGSSTTTSSTSTTTTSTSTTSTTAPQNATP